MADSQDVATVKTAQIKQTSRKNQPVSEREQWWTKVIGLAGLIAIVAMFYKVVAEPKYKIYDTSRYIPFEALNNEDCTPIREIAGCEDQFIDQRSGISYLACTDLAARAHWNPPMLAFDHEKIAKPWNPQNSPGHLIMYDTRSGKHKRLQIENWPVNSIGLFSTHGIDAFIDRTSSPDHPRVTIFAINHRPPLDPDAAQTEGADSVVEVFETTLGSDTARYLRTISSDVFMVTPNSIMAISPTAFYFSNDHAEKVSTLRRYEHLLNPRESDIVFYDGSEFEVVAASAVLPNGLARGPGSTFYAASTLRGKLLVFETQRDGDAILNDVVYIGRAIDNVKVAASGTIVLAVMPSIPKLAGKFFKNFQVEFTRPGMRETLANGQQPVVPSEVWIVRNDTSQARFYGGKYETLRIFGDNGTKAPGVTNAMLYKDELYTTGIYGHLTRCRLPSGVLTANVAPRPQIPTQDEL